MKRFLCSFLITLGFALDVKLEERIAVTAVYLKTRKYRVDRCAGMNSQEDLLQCFVHNPLVFGTILFCVFTELEGSPACRLETRLFFRGTWQYRVGYFAFVRNLPSTLGMWSTQLIPIIPSIYRTTIENSHQLSKASRVFHV